MPIGIPTLLGTVVAANAASAAVTLFPTTAAGELLLALPVTVGSTTWTGVTDTASNTYTQGTKLSGASSASAAPYYSADAASVASSGAITFSVTPKSNLFLAAVAVSGCSTLDNQGAGSTGSGTNLSVSEGSPTASSRIVFGYVVAASQSEGFGTAPGWTALGAFNDGTGHSVFLAYIIVTGSTAPVTFSTVLNDGAAPYIINTISFGAAALPAVGAISTSTRLLGVGRAAAKGAGAIALRTTLHGAPGNASAVGTISLHTVVAGVPVTYAPAAGTISLFTAPNAVGYSHWDWRQTVISQYANSPSLLRLISDFSKYVDQNTNMQAFYDLIWNIDTAVGYGLDVWGRIVGVGRVLSVSTQDYFSFQQANNPSEGPFGGGPFFSGVGATANFSLSDDAFRQLIMAKAASNICNGSIPAINQIMMLLFSDLGNCYVLDSGDMTMSYVFGAEPNPVQYAIVSQSGVLPRPTGVLATITVSPVAGELDFSSDNPGNPLIAAI